MNKITEDLQNEVQWELENNILPFWMNRMIDNEYGGFHGQITGNGQRVVHAPKGAILNARILWTFSAAYRLLRKPEYLETATRAKRYLTDGKIKYIWNFHNGSEQLFDLREDPGETHNLSEDAAYQNKLSELRKMMVEHLSERGDSFVKDGKLMTLDTTLLYSPNFPK